MFKQHSRFLDWFAGFTDGEGCFYAKFRDKGLNGNMDIGFRIKLRDDDHEVLKEAQAVVGGRITSKPLDDVRNGVVMLTFSSVSDCMRLCMIFHHHQLRAKKKRDFAIWQQIVMLKYFKHPASSYKHLEDELKQVRRYKEVSKHEPEAEPASGA